jgi:hypothetical protein
MAGWNGWMGHGRKNYFVSAKKEIRGIVKVRGLDKLIRVDRKAPGSARLPERLEKDW